MRRERFQAERLRRVVSVEDDADHQLLDRRLMAVRHLARDMGVVAWNPVT